MLWPSSLLILSLPSSKSTGRRGPVQAGSWRGRHIVRHVALRCARQRGRGWWCRPGGEDPSGFHPSGLQVVGRQAGGSPSSLTSPGMARANPHSRI